jgi:hypothetical protein
MRINQQRSTSENNRRDWSLGLYPETEHETAKAYGDRAALAQALPTLNPTATPQQHASAAARIVADMDAEGDIARRPKIGNVY